MLIIKKGDFHAPTIFALHPGAFCFVVQTGPTPGAARGVWFILFCYFHPFLHPFLDRLDFSGVHYSFFMFGNRGKSFSRVVKLSNLKSVNYL